MDKKFKERSGQLNLAAINDEVNKEWDKNDVFHRSMTEREGGKSYVFFEGKKLFTSSSNSSR